MTSPNPAPPGPLSPALTAPPDLIQAKFAALRDRRSVAALLEVPDDYLVWHLYRFPASRRYRAFDILKRDGKLRRILAPVSRIRILQRKLADVLNVIYTPTTVAHGFVLKRNIATNAAVHRNRNWVLRLDLQDFFPSINFGRVRGLFLSKPYGLPEEVATVLAQLCCHDGALPQGAPTSPIISNMICSRLDNELRRLAADHRCVVTRYADDMTLSSQLRDLPSGLATRHLTSEGYVTTIGPALEHVVTSNGFAIHPAKSRLLHRTQNQNVTGVVVNSKLNVARRMRDQVRSTLRAWEKHSLPAATDEWHRKFDVKKRAGAKKPSFRRVLQGKLAHIAMIKGFGDPSYQLLLSRYSRLTGVPTVQDALWVIETPEGAGTGFMLKGVGLVTCFHVVEGTEAMAFQPTTPDERFPVTIVHALPNIDLAICSVDGASGSHELHRSVGGFRVEQTVRVLGYPDWNPGNSIWAATGNVLNVRKFFGAGYAHLDIPTRRGNSGGPVLDERGHVVGIVRTGARYSGDEDPNGIEHGALAVDALDTVIRCGPNGELPPGAGTS